MCNIQKNILYFGLIFSSQMFLAITDQAIDNVQEKIVKRTAGLFAPLTDNLIPINEVLPYTGVAVQLYWVGSDMKTYCFPNEQELVRAVEIDAKLVEIKAVEKFRNCLIANTLSSTRDLSGRPTACEELARMLIKIRKKDDVIDMTAIYNQNRR